MKLLLILLVSMNIVLSSYANCHTGFACSINSLEDVVQNKMHKEFSEKLNNYFSREINEDFFFSKKPSQIAYNDLFIFNTIV